MVPNITLMHKVWDGLLSADRKQTHLPKLNFDELISSVFTAGPFYFYIIDFFDMSISNISSGFYEAHGVDPATVQNIDDILTLIHPDDMAFVSKAEEKVFTFINENIGKEKITHYKESYNFRFRTMDGSYQMYNHQSVILTVDDQGNFIKSLNIHTNINHITKKNNYRASLIGLGGEPSYLNLEVSLDPLPVKKTDDNIFSRRELQIINLMSKGLDTPGIAEKLYVSVNTIKAHRKNILRKAQCNNAAELIARSMSEGWI